MHIVSLVTHETNTDVTICLLCHPQWLLKILGRPSACLKPSLLGFLFQENVSWRNVTLPKKGQTNERTNKGEESIISSEISLFANQVLFIWQSLCSLDYVLWFGLSYCQKEKLPGEQSHLNNWSQAFIPQLCCWLVHENTERQHSSSKGAGGSSAHELGQRISSMQQQASLGLRRWRNHIHPHFKENLRPVLGAKTKYSAMLLILCFEQAVGFVDQHLLIWIQTEIQCVFISCHVQFRKLWNPRKKPPVIRSPNKYFKKIRVCKERVISN